MCIQAQSNTHIQHKKQNKKSRRKVLSPINTHKWTRIAIDSSITLRSLFSVQIAYDYFSSANGHISEVRTHTHRSSFIVVIKRERGRMNARQEGVKMIFFLRGTRTVRQRCVCVCENNFLSLLIWHISPDAYQHPFNPQKEILVTVWKI